MSRPFAAERLGGRSTRELVFFLLVGVSNTALTYVAYLALLRLTDYGWAFTGAFLVGLTYTGLLNIRLTFSHHPTVMAWVVFGAYYTLYYLCTLLLLHVLVDGIGIDKHWALLVMLPVVVPINFIMTRLIVHRFGRAILKGPAP